MHIENVQCASSGNVQCKFKERSQYTHSGNVLSAHRECSVHIGNVQCAHSGNVFSAHIQGTFSVHIGNVQCT